MMNRTALITAICAAGLLAAISGYADAGTLVKFDAPKNRVDGSAIEGTLSYGIYVEDVMLAETEKTEYLFDVSYTAGTRLCATARETYPSSNYTVESAKVCGTLMSTTTIEPPQRFMILQFD